MAYIESVIIRDTGGTEADVTAANALKVDGSAVTQPVSVVGGTVSALVDLQQDVFNELVVATRYNQVEINYATADPDSISDLTVTKTNGGDASNLNGQAVFTSNANTNGGVKAVTDLAVAYRPQSESYAAFSAIWPSGGLANSYQRLGIYDTNNGFFIGYEGTSFGITLRKAAVDTFIAQASWNVDTLIGGVGSKYTRNGVPEAIDFTKDNIYRVRFGWLGAANIYWETMSPDGEWVLFNVYRHPNTTGGTSINNPDIPITLDIQKTGAGATVLTMNTACWAGGTTSPYTKLSSTITDNTEANMTRAVIAGRASTGGGTYYNVKVTPSGAIVTAGAEVYPEDSAHTSGDEGAFVLAVRNDTNAAMTSTDGNYSPIAVNANGAVAINDGGNSVTVDAPVGTPVNVQIGDGTDTADVIPLTSNDALAVAIVDGSGNQVTSFGGGIQYQEDTPHTTGDTGTMSLAVRNDDAGTAFTSNNGDYSPIAVDSRGQLFVTTASSSSLNVNVTNILNEGQQTMANSISVAIASDQSAVPVSGTVAATQSGAWNVGVNNGAGAAAVNIQDGGNSITVDGTVTSTISGTVSVSVDADTVGLATEVTLQQVSTDVAVVANSIYREDDPHTTGEKGQFVLAVRNDTNAVVTSTDGDYSQISVNDKGAIAIQDGGNSITVDGTVGVSGTVTVSGTVAATQSGTWILGANSGVDIGDVTINNAAGAAAVNIQDGGNSITVDGTIAATQSGTWNVVAAGDVAHDSPDSGNPVKIGFQAETVLPAAVANGDRTNGTADQFGRQLVTHISPGMQTWKSANYTTTQTGVAVWTPGAGKTIAVTYLAVSSYATTTGRVIVWFGASGDTTYTAGTDQLVWAGSFAPGTSSKPGAILNFPTPVFSANVDYILRVTTDANISLDVSVYGYEF
jgi:hypothetical protein